VLAGLAHAVLDSQRIFRAVLDASSHPGRLVAVPPPVETPTPLWPATASLCLALVDMDTPLWLDAAARAPDVAEYFRFHCGCPIATTPGIARFAIVADPRQMPALEEFDVGTDEYPDRSATVIVQVEALEEGIAGQRLAGPGIESEARLLVRGLPEGFWRSIRQNHALFPRGVDVILSADHLIAAIPRTTRVTG